MTWDIVGGGAGWPSSPPGEGYAPAVASEASRGQKVGRNPAGHFPPDQPQRGEHGPGAMRRGVAPSSYTICLLHFAPLGPFAPATMRSFALLLAACLLGSAMAQLPSVPASCSASVPDFAALLAIQPEIDVACPPGATVCSTACSTTLEKVGRPRGAHWSLVPHSFTRAPIEPNKAPVLTLTFIFRPSCLLQYGNKCLRDASALGGAGPDKLAEIDAGCDCSALPACQAGCFLICS